MPMNSVEEARGVLDKVYVVLLSPMRDLVFMSQENVVCTVDVNRDDNVPGFYSVILSAPESQGEDDPPLWCFTLQGGEIRHEELFFPPESEDDDYPYNPETVRLNSGDAALRTLRTILEKCGVRVKNNRGGIKVIIPLAKILSEL